MTDLAAIREVEQVFVTYFDRVDAKDPEGAAAVFAEDARTLYEDDCCHFNETGRRLLAARIAELAAARLAPTLAPAEGETAAQPPAAPPSVR